MIDPDRQRLAKRYAQQKRALLAAEIFLAAAYLVACQIALSAGGLHVLRPAGIALLFVVLAVVFELLVLPLSWIEYQLARGYGLSVQTAGSWFADQLKTLALTILLGGGLVELAYLLMRLEPRWWWLATAGVMFLFTVLLANLAPVLIAPRFYKFTPLADPELTNRLLALARKAGTAVRGVFTIHLSEKTTAANAALMGWGNTRRIVIGDTLTASFTHDETEAVLAHELGHHVHHDIPKAIALETAAVLATLGLSSVVFQALSGLGAAPPLPDAAGMPLLALLFSFWSALFTPLTNWASRRSERQADRYAIQTATRPEAFTHSMIRLANQNLAEIDPPRWVELLLHDHPAIKRRIEMFESKSEPSDIADDQVAQDLEKDDGHPGRDVHHAQ
ncbi:MAG: M48 family metallopeptidase [Chloroflexota bacterium]|nr:M48 family metallopeptidase [Chloroflexota bacterium]